MKLAPLCRKKSQIVAGATGRRMNIYVVEFWFNFYARPMCDRLNERMRIDKRASQSDPETVKFWRWHSDNKCRALARCFDT